jgi:hypothetical protein
MEKQYEVYGEIVIPVNISVSAEYEREAEEKAIIKLKEEYNLNVVGYSHNPDEVGFKDFYVVEE